MNQEHIKIKIQNLNMTFQSGRGEVEAIKSIDLDVFNGEFLCIVGSSGCGKTTLLYILAGLLKKTSGSTKLMGQEIMGPGPDRALVFQSDAVFPWMSVYDNISFGLRSRGVKKDLIKQTVSKYISLIGLEGFENSFSRELSGGMRKRVDLARCFANLPDVLLMDEPFGALDVFTKEILQLEILRIWNETKTTIIFVTHDLEEALFLADRIIILSPRPSVVDQIIKSPFSRPRDFSLRTEPKFQQIRTNLWKLFKEQQETNN